MDQKEKEPTSRFWGKLFEQSFVVVCLVLGFTVLFTEYKSLFEKLLNDKDRDFELLLERNKELRNENVILYEKLINCKHGATD